MKNESYLIALMTVSSLLISGHQTTITRFAFHYSKQYQLLRPSFLTFFFSKYLGSTGNLSERIRRLMLLSQLSGWLIFRCPVGQESQCLTKVISVTPGGTIKNINALTKRIPFDHLHDLRSMHWTKRKIQGME